MRMIIEDTGPEDVAFDPAEKFVAGLDMAGGILRWDAVTGKPLSPRATPVGEQRYDPPMRHALSLDGHAALLVWPEGRVFDPKTGKETRPGVWRSRAFGTAA